MQSDAIDLLQVEHFRIRGLFDRLKYSYTDDERRGLFKSLKDELEHYSFIEEKIFYPRFESLEGFSFYLDDSYDEHQEVRNLLEEIDEIEDQILKSRYSGEFSNGSEEEPSEESVKDQGDKKWELFDELESALEELTSVINQHIDKEERRLFPKIREVLVRTELERLAKNMVRKKTPPLAA